MKSIKVLFMGSGLFIVRVPENQPIIIKGNLVYSDDCEPITVPITFDVIGIVDEVINSEYSESMLERVGMTKEHWEGFSEGLKLHADDIIFVDNYAIQLAKDIEHETE